MHGTLHTHPAVHPVGSGVNAVIWIEPGRAIVLRGSGTGEPASLELPLPPSPAATPAVLAEIAHLVGDVDRVLVLGADDLRTALEREIVAVGHRPEAIHEEPGHAPLDEVALVARLRQLG